MDSVFFPNYFSCDVEYLLYGVYGRFSVFSYRLVHRCVLQGFFCYVVRVVFRGLFYFFLKGTNLFCVKFYFLLVECVWGYLCVFP